LPTELCVPAMRSRAFTVDCLPVRIVSLLPSATEIVCLLGLGEQLVGTEAAAAVADLAADAAGTPPRHPRPWAGFCVPRSKHLPTEGRMPKDVILTPEGPQKLEEELELLPTEKGAPLVRFAYSTDGTARRGPVTSSRAMNC